MIIRNNVWIKKIERRLSLLLPGFSRTNSLVCGCSRSHNEIPTKGTFTTHCSKADRFGRVRRGKKIIGITHYVLHVVLRHGRAAPAINQVVFFPSRCCYIMAFTPNRERGGEGEREKTARKHTHSMNASRRRRRSSQPAVYPELDACLAPPYSYSVRFVSLFYDSELRDGVWLASPEHTQYEYRKLCISCWMEK